MSSTTIQKAGQRGPAYSIEGEQDLLKSKIIEHFNQLTLDADFQKASATYDKVREQQQEIQIRDEKIAELQRSLKVAEENKVVALTQLSEVNQTLTAQKDNAEKDNASLRRDATEKEKSMNEMSRRMQILQGQIQTELSERDDKKRELELLIEQHNRDIDSLQSELKEREVSIDHMKTTNANLESLITAERTKSNGLEEEKNLLDQKMRKARNRLEKFDAFIFGYCETDEQSIIDGFSSLWHFATHEIWAVLRQNLTNDSLGNERLWKNFRLNVDNAIQDKTVQGHSVPLCSSNSDAAKGMRLAVMLGVLAREINREIFQPSYFPSETGHFRMIFNNLAEDDIEKEQFYRSVLLSIDRDGQEAELQSRATAVVQNVSHFLDELLSNAQYVEFKERIKNVVNRAIEIWRPIQHATKRYETDFDPADWDHDEDPLFQFPMGGQDQIEAEHSDSHLFVVFPGLSSLESDVTILTSVIPLMSSQKLCVDAKREVRGQSSPTTKQPNRKRQNSVVQAQAQSNGINFLGGYSGGLGN